MKRREFIKTTALSVPLVALFPPDLSSITRDLVAGKIEKRSLGKTGKKLSIIGFGGIVVKDATPEDASSIVKFAYDAGVNYFDVAPSYGDAEIKLGPALEPYRKKVFLACKTMERTREGARKELEQSLLNLKTDHFDLYQMHAVTNMKDVETLLGKGGALETFLEAKKEGKIKFIGFSAHSVEAATALMNGFDFDTILFPFSIATWHNGNFGPQVMELAKQKQMGILALKTMAKGPWAEGADRSKYPKLWYEPFASEEEIKMGLRFAFSHPITSAIPPGDAHFFKMALKLKNQLTPLKNDEVEMIKTKGLSINPLFKYPMAAND